VIFGKVKWPAGRAGKLLPDGDYTIGIRPHNIGTEGHGKAVGAIDGRVLVTELSGSESVIHCDIAGKTWISQSHGIHPFSVGANAKLFVDIDQSLFFGANNEFIA
jgi:glycerol transport system ATP-binding protein